MMSEWVPGATLDAMNRLVKHAQKVGLQNTEEFTFRAMFMAATYDLFCSAKFQTEWKKFDLLVQIGGESTLIEFKYYLLRQTFDLQGRPLAYKGGAGPKNETEFQTCLQKLRIAVPSEVGHRRLVLVYERDYSRRSNCSFQRSYGGLRADERIAEVWPLTAGPLEARVIRPRSS